MLEYLALGDSALLLAGQDGKTTVVTDDRLDQVGKQLRAPVDELPIVDPFNLADRPDVLDALGSSGPDEVIRRCGKRRKAIPTGSDGRAARQGTTRRSSIGCSPRSHPGRP